MVAGIGTVVSYAEFARLMQKSSEGALVGPIRVGGAIVAEFIEQSAAAGCHSSEALVLRCLEVFDICHVESDLLLPALVLENCRFHDDLEISQLHIRSLVFRRVITDGDIRCSELTIDAALSIDRCVFGAKRISSTASFEKSRCTNFSWLDSSVRKVLLFDRFIAEEKLTLCGVVTGSVIARDISCDDFEMAGSERRRSLVAIEADFSRLSCRSSARFVGSSFGSEKGSAESVLRLDHASLSMLSLAAIPPEDSQTGQLRLIKGGLSLVGAVIGHSLDLRGICIRNGSAVAIAAKDLRCRDLLLSGREQKVATDIQGAAVFDRCSAGEVKALGCSLWCDSDYALRFRGASLASLDISSLVKRRTTVIGGINLEDAKIAGSFDMSGAHVQVRADANDSFGDRLAINGHGIQAGSIFTGSMLDAVDSEEDVSPATIIGRISFRGGQVETEVNFSSCTVDAQDPTIEYGAYAAIDVCDLHMPKGDFIIYSILFDDHVSDKIWWRGDIDLTSAHVRSIDIITGTPGLTSNKTLPTLMMNYLVVAERVDISALDKKCERSGRRIEEIRASSMKINGDFVINAGVRGDADFSGCEVAGSLLLEIECDGSLDLSNSISHHLDVEAIAPAKTLSLFNAKTERLTDHVEAWGMDQFDKGMKVNPIILANFAYNTLDEPFGGTDVKGVRSWQNRLHWLSRQPGADRNKANPWKGAEFNPQPWRQLALTLQQAGYDEAAQRITIARRTAYRNSSNCKWLETWWLRLLDATGEYGFNPRRTFIISLLLITFFAMIFGFVASGCSNVGCMDGERYVPLASGDVLIAKGLNDEVPPYPSFDPILFSIDQFVPLVDFGHSNLWAANDRWAVVLAGTRISVGVIMKWLVFFERLLGTFLTAYIVVGLTGLVRREH